MFLEALNFPTQIVSWYFGYQKVFFSFSYLIILLRLICMYNACFCHGVTCSVSMPCINVHMCGTVYWSPIGRPLIAWHLSRGKRKKEKTEKKKKSKQRNSFVNSLLLLAADLAQVVMPVLLEHTHKHRTATHH